MRGLPGERLVRREGSFGAPPKKAAACASSPGRTPQLLCSATSGIAGAIPEPMARDVDAAEVEKATFDHSAPASIRISVYPLSDHPDRVQADTLDRSKKFFSTLVLNRRPRFPPPSVAASPRPRRNPRGYPAPRFLIRRWTLGVGRSTF